ncbi:MAG: hypothetical protein KGM98_11855 [Bacteroidota bacterium]|nr:hypothetical protein [Bacteroidota bacterium]
MMKRFRLALLFIFGLLHTGLAQITPTDYQTLHKMDTSLETYARQIIQGRTSVERFTADSMFTRMLVRALKVRHSFEFPFNSMISISKLVPPDSSFRIFTWQLVINDNEIRPHGAIQMRTPDGSLKLFPLIDKTDLTQNIDDTIANNFGWIGALYYKIIQTEAFGRKVYTLLGYDINDLNSNIKLIDVLTFDKNGQPIFGGPYFSFQDNSLHPAGMARYIMVYKKNASPRLTYDPHLGMIIYEHLISETGEPQKRWTYIPDGDYEGLVWRDGKWVHIEKVFTYKTPEGQEPVPQPILDPNGNIDETRLSKVIPDGYEKPSERSSNGIRMNK